MRYLFCLLVSAALAHAQVSVLQSPVVVLPIPPSQIAASQIAVATQTTNGVAIVLQSAATDFQGIISSSAGALISDQQRTRFLSLLGQYDSASHLTPVPLDPGSTNLPTFRMSPASVELWQLAERLEAKNIAIAFVSPPATNAPPVVTNGPPPIVIIIPDPNHDPSSALRIRAQ